MKRIATSVLLFLVLVSGFVQSPFAQQAPSNDEEIFNNNCTLVILRGLKNFLRVTTYASINQKCYELTTIYQDRIHHIEICPSYVSAYAFKDGVVFNVELSMIPSGDFSLSIVSTAENALPLVYIISITSDTFQPIRIFPNTSTSNVDVAFFMMLFCMIK